MKTLNTVITGGSTGLGAAILTRLKEEPAVQFKPYNVDVLEGYNVASRHKGNLPNVSDHESPFTLPVETDILINNAAINSQDWIEDIDYWQFRNVMDTNVWGIINMTQHCLPGLIERKGVILNIVSNAARVPMTCSALYNASKGAAEILTRQMARELTKKYGITVFSISPCKIEGTPMSRQIEEGVLRTRGWDAEFAEEYQKNALLGGEIDPDSLADFIRYLLMDKRRHKHLSGCDLHYGA